MMMQILATSLPFEIYTLPAKNWKKAREAQSQGISSVKHFATSTTSTTTKKSAENSVKRPSSDSHLKKSNVKATASVKKNVAK